MARNDPHSYTDLDQGRVIDLELDLHLDFDEKIISGTAVLHLDSPKAGPLDLDTRDLHVEAVEDHEGRALVWHMDDPEGFMGSRMVIQRTEPTDTIEIRYRTSPTASALQWLEPEHTAGKQHPYMLSQCQAIHARSMVPIQDSPQVRFSYAASLTVPKDLTPIMSAKPGERRPGPDFTTSTYRFLMPQPIPAYLLAMAVGHMEARDLGPRTRVYAEPEVLEAAAYEFAQVEDMITASEELFGPYLWERFDFAVMPPAFPYGGMENPRLTFLTPTLISGDRAHVSVLAHELAHSWTGNLVTNASMNDFWLNEGFTVWAERRIIEKLYGPERVALEATIGWQALRGDLERFGPDSPFTRLKNDLTGVDPDEVYSLVPYEKGFLFVTLLERTVGREAFDEFVHAYIERFKFTSITTEQFIEFLESYFPGLLEKVDGRAWIYGPGIPDNRPRFESETLNHIQDAAKAFSAGELPRADEMKSWPAHHWQIFLQSVDRPLDHDRCQWLDQTFRLGDSGDYEILSNWLNIAAASGYEPMYPKLREFLGSVGRMKYLKPLYRALYDRESTKALAREIFSEHAAKYHPIARAGLEAMLGLS